MSKRRLVIAGTGSGVGKTTFTIGIMAALQQKGYTVQGFKCGPIILILPTIQLLRVEFQETWIAGCLSIEQCVKLCTSK